VRRPDDDDGRLVRVRLTAAGRRRIDSAFGALLDSERELVAALADFKRERLAAGLRELLAAAVSGS
jgi:DNA-binding MarR family transcriptional regulator